MKPLLSYITIVIALVLELSGGCENRITPPSQDQPAATIGDTSYVEINPPWGPFEDARALLFGNEQLIYVADYGRDSVYMMDANGTILGSHYVRHPIALAQNSKLDLYISGEELAPNGADTVGAIYRLFVVRFDTTLYDTMKNSLGGDSIVARLQSTYYDHDIKGAHMQRVWMEPAHPDRRFTGIGILPNNDYLVTRFGPDNSSFVDPDTRVLLFSKNDQFQTPLSDLQTRSSGGTAITDIRNLTGIVVIPSTNDFIITQSNEQVAYGVIWMEYKKTNDFVGWLPKFDPSNESQRGIDFIQANRFVSACAVAYDRRRRDVFVVDSELDSLVKFDRTGRFKSESFGRYKSASSQFPLGLQQPRGIAFGKDCTLYVADTGNKFIRRFRLSTQILCN